MSLPFTKHYKNAKVTGAWGSRESDLWNRRTPMIKNLGSQARRIKQL